MPSSPDPGSRANAANAANTAWRVRVLVVIPALNEASHIEAVVSGLLAHVSPAHELQLVVADGGSTDATAQLVQAMAEKHPELSLLQNPARIQSAAINLAARRFGRDADVLIRCDAHALYPEGYCDRLLETLERTGADAVVVPLDSLGSGRLQRAVAWVSNSLIGTGGSAHRAGRESGFVDHGHHAAFRMDMFRKCGGYDESFTHNEDAELDQRQRAHGAKIYLDSTIRVGYHPRADFASLWRQYFRYGAGRSRTMRRHPGSLRLRQALVPAHFAVCVVAVAVSPWFPALLLWPALYLSVLAGSSLAIALRERSLCGLLAGPAAGVMHSAWACGFFWKLFGWRERAWSRDMTVPLWPLVGEPQP